MIEYTLQQSAFSVSSGELIIILMAKMSNISSKGIPLFLILLKIE